MGIGLPSRSKAWLERGVVWGGVGWVGGVVSGGAHAGAVVEEGGSGYVA